MSSPRQRGALTARYARFIDELRSQRRYFFSSDSRAFLARLGRLAADRVHKLPSGHSLYRARKNAVVRRGSDYVADLHPWPAAEMIPALNMGTEDRANPYNIQMLYLATSPEIAIAEVRTGIDFPVTVATFRLRRALRLVDLDENGGGERRRPESRLWQRISADFSRSLSAEERRLSCLHTQTVAELFRDRGFDGLLYRSQFTAWRGDTAIAQDEALNIVVFDPRAVAHVGSKVWTVRRQSIEATPLPARRSRRR